MRRPIETLRKLMSLYGVVEEMHLIEVQRLTGAVHEVQRAIHRQQEVVLSACSAGRGALIHGDRLGWSVAEVQRESASWKREQLENVRLQREQMNALAKEQHTVSRSKTEQMKSVVQNATAQARIEELRQMQARSDDRFLARRQWTGSNKPHRVNEY
jgi:hypothetical protein